MHHAVNASCGERNMRTHLNTVLEEIFESYTWDNWARRPYICILWAAWARNLTSTGRRCSDLCRSSVYSRNHERRMAKTSWARFISKRTCKHSMTAIKSGTRSSRWRYSEFQPQSWPVTLTVVLLRARFAQTHASWLLAIASNRILTFNTQCSKLVFDKLKLFRKNTNTQ
jgi:hypothetical protein